MNGMGVTAKLVKEAFSVRSSLPENEHADKVLKTRSASEQMKSQARSSSLNFTLSYGHMCLNLIMRG